MLAAAALAASWLATPPVVWSANKLQEQVDAGIAVATAVSVPGGDYIFANASLLISGAGAGFALRAADPSGIPVRLWFDIGYGVVTTNSADIEIKGPIEIDYTTGAHYQGTVTALHSPQPVLPAAAPLTLGRCFRREHVDVSKCEASDSYDLWLRSNGNWVRHPQLNCFNGTGAVTIAPEPFSVHATLGQCQDACDASPACSAPDGGIIVSATSPTPPLVGGTLTVTTDPGFLDPDVYCRRYCHWSQSEHEIPAQLWASGGGGFAVGHGTKAPQLLNKTSAGKFTFSSSPLSKVKLGDKIYIGIRGGVTLHTHNSSRVTFRNITIHGASL